MHRDVALAGGAALAAGLFLGYIAEKLTRNAAGSEIRPVAPLRAPGSPAPLREAAVVTDVLERYRVAAAF
jgi:hypothetical protein